MLIRFKWTCLHLLETLLGYTYNTDLEFTISGRVANLSEQIGYWCMVDNSELTIQNRISFVLFGYFGKGYYIAGPHYTLIQEPPIAYWGTYSCITKEMQRLQVWINNREEYKVWLSKLNTSHVNCRCSLVGDVEGEDHPSQAEYWIE